MIINLWKSVSMFAFLLKGENDDYLPWPFTGTVTVELLNQLEDKKFHWRRKHGCTGCWCTHEISEWNTHKVILCSEVFFMFRLI